MKIYFLQEYGPSPSWWCSPLTSQPSYRKSRREHINMSLVLFFFIYRAGWRSIFLPKNGPYTPWLFTQLNSSLFFMQNTGGSTSTCPYGPIYLLGFEFFRILNNAFLQKAQKLKKYNWRPTNCHQMVCYLVASKLNPRKVGVNLYLHRSLMLSFKFFCFNWIYFEFKGNQFQANKWAISFIFVLTF